VEMRRRMIYSGCNGHRRIAVDTLQVIEQERRKN
jgi:hypothetical protein